jgi:hypothetical protein
MQMQTRRARRGRRKRLLSPTASPLARAPGESCWRSWARYRARPHRGSPLCADVDGLSLHAALRADAHDRQRLEQLCRYLTRPALSDERVQLNAAGQVELKLKKP